MANGFSKQIQERIGAAVDGTIFVNSDFADIADQETVRRTLNRLTQAGMLRRIRKGVYEKPKYSKLLHEYVAADPDGFLLSFLLNSVLILMLSYGLLSVMRVEQNQKTFLMVLIPSQKQKWTLPRYLQTLKICLLSRLSAKITPLMF